MNNDVYYISDLSNSEDISRIDINIDETIDKIILNEKGQYKFFYMGGHTIGSYTDNTYKSIYDNNIRIQKVFAGKDYMGYLDLSGNAFASGSITTHLNNGEINNKYNNLEYKKIHTSDNIEIIDVKSGPDYILFHCINNHDPDDKFVSVYGTNYFKTNIDISTNFLIDLSISKINLDDKTLFNDIFPTYQSIYYLCDNSINIIGDNIVGFELKDMVTQKNISDIKDISHSSIYDSSFVKIIASKLFTIADESGNVWSCGINVKNQLGRNTFDEYSNCFSKIKTTIDISGWDIDNIKDLSDISDIAVGEDFTLALRKDGTLYSWGNKHYGQLGLNYSKINSRYINIPLALPLDISDISNISEIQSGQHYSLALSNSKNLYAWGKNSDFQCTDINSAFFSIPDPRKISKKINVRHEKNVDEYDFYMTNKPNYDNMDIERSYYHDDVRMENKRRKRVKLLEENEAMGKKQRRRLYER